MVDLLGYTDPHTLPTPLSAMKGKTKIFQIRFGRSSKRDAMEFIVDNVFEDPEPPATPTSTASQDVTTPAPTTPILPLPSPSTYTETKCPHQSVVKKELFQPPGIYNCLNFIVFFFFTTFIIHTHKS